MTRADNQVVERIIKELDSKLNCQVAYDKNFLGQKTIVLRFPNNWNFFMVINEEDLYETINEDGLYKVNLTKEIIKAAEQSFLINNFYK